METKKKVKIDKKYFHLLIFIILVLALSIFILENKRKHSDIDFGRDTPHLEDPYYEDQIIDDDGYIGLKCDAESRKADFCYELYYPVCGHDSKGNVVGEYSNDCYACKDSKVDYIFYRECE